MSEGLDEWKAPEQMKRMWFVLTLPYLVGTTEPAARAHAPRGAGKRTSTRQRVLRLHRTALRLAEQCCSVRWAFCGWGA